MTDFSEEPSDGFKIGIAILGIVRATENPASKISREFLQNVFAEILRQNWNEWNSTGVSYLKNTILQLIFENLTIQSKANALNFNSFLET